MNIGFSTLNVDRGRPYPLRPTRRAFAAIAGAACGITACGITASALAADAVQTGPGVTVTGSGSEATYARSLHEQLDRAKRYPTGREASLGRPAGTSEVWFDVDRAGRITGHGMNRSSGSMLLDQMATSLVLRTNHAALPADAWTDDGSAHRFVVRYRFVPPGETVAPDATVRVALVR